MCSWRILYTFVPIFIGLYITEYRKDILNFIRLQSKISDDFDKQLDLMIYIPSARENSHKRQAIRDTWANILNSTSNLPVALNFVVGDSACEVPLEYRKDEYGCEEWLLPSPINVDDNTKHAVVVVERNEKVNKRSPSVGNDASVNGDEDGEEEEEEDEDEGVYPVQKLEFTVHHDVVVRSLGVHEVCLTGGSVVRLLEATTSKEIVSVSFKASSSSSSSSSSPFSFKSIEPPYILPKGFRGLLEVESRGENGASCDFKYWDFPWDSVHNTSNIIEFSESPTIPHGTYQNEEVWGRRPFVVANFAFKIFELQGLKNKVSRRHKLRQELITNNSLEQSALLQESSTHGDVLFVPVVDVYRNLPKKFLLFAEQMLAKDIKAVLKVDDDAYVDLDAVLKLIASVNSNENVWFGRFRHNWPINKHGKWADQLYTSPVYPRFACGSGYVLTAGVFKWLGRNSQQLQLYQGEDVSMGIWLSALKHRIVDDPLWQCENECISDMYSMPDLRTDLLIAHWQAKVTCGDPCGCD